MRTNIFLNAYSQPENKLTYNFLALVELLNDAGFCSFLTGRNLAENPVTGIKLVYGGRKSNPDGSFQVKQTNGKSITVYFENKTYRRGLDIEQLLGHLDCCGDDDVLLLVTPRQADIEIVKKVNSPKIRFKTWGDISGYLKKYESPIARQFAEYGKLSGEFEELGELHANDILLFSNSFKINFNRKIDNILQELYHQIDLAPFGFDVTNKKRQNCWGRNSIEVNIEQSYCSYGQWYSIAYYYNEEDHNITFKNEIPEIAIFFDVDPQHKQLLREDNGFEELLSRLVNNGFESNLHDDLSHNQWRLFFYRKSITDFDTLNAHQLMLFADEVFGKLINAGCMEHQYFKEISRSYPLL